MRDLLAIPVVVGRKTDRERFAGATSTYTLEAMTGDRKALQMGTSHELGQNFARAFDISYSTSTGSREHAWTTSWGTSTRMVGGLIMCHGDDNGLRVPPALAPVQALVTVVKETDGSITAAARALVEELAAAGVRVKLDDRVDTPFGRRAVDAELKGIPIRVEVGPRDLAEGRVVMVRRILAGAEGSKTPLALGETVAAVTAALDADQKALYDDALAFREAATVDVSTLDDALAAAATGWARVPWSAIGVDGEAKANESAITVRCLFRADGSVPASQDEPDLTAILARSY
jgi:prolyl-tRNA synthetase